MRHISFGFAIALAAILMIAAGCEKEVTDKIGSNEETDGPATVTLGVQIGDATKTYIDAGTRTPMWINDDILAVNSLQQPVRIQESNGSSAKLYNVQKADHYYAIYPYDIVRDNMTPSSTTILLDNVQTYKEDGSGHQIVEAPMAAYSTTTSLTFHNLCSLLKVRFTNDGSEVIRLSEIKVKGEKSYLCGYGLITSIKGDGSDVITMTSSQYSLKNVSLDLGNNYGVVNAGVSKDFYIVLPPFAEQSVTVTIIQDATHYASFTGTNALAHNKIVQVKFKASDIVEQSAPLGAINSLFTINSNGDQVYFSRGNLQCTLTAAKTCTWAFADNQWDYIGGQTSGGSQTQTGNNLILSDTSGELSSYPATVDLFGWSSDNTKNLPDGYEITYSNFYGIIGNTHPLVCNNDISNPYLGDFVDWGKPVTEGGYYGGTWRTLTKDEWEYITKTRNEEYKYMKCNVHGTNGMILFPDNYSCPDKLSNECIIVNDGNYNKTISNSDWYCLEGVGCVFLPIAGQRAYGEYSYVDEDFCYRLATPYGNSSSYHTSAQNTSFNSRALGYPVRLVQDK